MEENMLEPLLHGIILAFGLILPLGVQNVFIFNQGATHNKVRKAFPSVITAGICDTILIVLAVAGVSVMVLNFEWLRTIIFFVGFLFLMYMGWVMWKSSPIHLQKDKTKQFTARRQVVFAASVSLLNPHAILDTIGVIGTSSLVYSGYEKWVFTLSCIIVSWLWFFGLAIAGRRLGSLDTSGRLLKKFNQLSAIIIWFMAIYIAYQLFQSI